MLSSRTPYISRLASELRAKVWPTVNPNTRIKKRGLPEGRKFIFEKHHPK